MINRQTDGGAVACLFNSCTAAICKLCACTWWVLNNTIQYMHDAKCVGGTRGQYGSTVQFCNGAQHMVLLCHSVVGVEQA